MKCCDCGQNVDEREFAAFICEQCADNRALTGGSANTSTNNAMDAIALADIRIVLEIGSGLGQEAIEKLIGQMVSVAQQHQ
jgi:hypothetical protein